ncbi:hypothetical protein [Azospirillum argentinense]
MVQAGFIHRYQSAGHQSAEAPPIAEAVGDTRPPFSVRLPPSGNR